jgi:hypothetical protein
MGNTTDIEVVTCGYGKKYAAFSVGCKKFTKSAQATGPENIGRERTLPRLLIRRPVNSPSLITLENNGKIRSQPDRETHFARASCGGNGPHDEPSLARAVPLCIVRKSRTRGSTAGALEIRSIDAILLAISWMTMLPLYHFPEHAH